MQRVRIRLRARQINYEIQIASGVLAEAGKYARAALGTSTKRASVISNQKVFGLFGKQVVRALRSAGFEVSHWLMKDGEQHKSMRSLEQALSFLGRSGVERNDA